MSYKTISRADAYEIGFGTEAPASLTNPKRLVNYTDLTELQCTIKSDGYIHSLSEYSTPRSDGKYRLILSDDIVAAGYVLTYVMNGHGEQIVPERVNSLPNPLPTPTAEDWMFNGWFLNSELTARATPGTKLTQDTTIYAKWVETTLRFGIIDGGSSSVIERTSISSITLNNITYEGDNLTVHYDSTTKKYTFTGFTDNNIIYDVVNTTESLYKDVSGMSQTFESLNNHNILLYQKTATVGDFTVTCNWNGPDDYIFDVYSLVYEGQAPYPTETGNTNSTKLLETSYSTDSDWYHIPQDETTGGFSVHYDTKGGSQSWSMGEFTTIRLDSGYTLEDMFRKYSFVFIVNDYSGGEPEKNSKTTSLFGTNATNMTINIQIGNITKTISLIEPSGTTQETSPKFANWIVFRTRLLGKNEELSSNIIEEFSDAGYSYFDGNNLQKTIAYDLHSGGKGYINN